jgi:hypothetical protein
MTTIVMRIMIEIQLIWILEHYADGQLTKRAQQILPAEVPKYLRSWRDPWPGL